MDRDRAWRDSLDRWLTTPPEDQPRLPEQTCAECDELLPAEPDRAEPGVSRTGQ